MSNANAFGYMEPTSVTTEANRHAFAVEQRLGRVRTITPVQVVSCTVNDTVSAIGTVNVKPLVNMVDGGGNATPHSTVFGLPYIRNQAGGNGIINDPQPGDVGLALICDRDISNVKASGGAGNPGSRRRFDFSDGVYLGTMLGGIPLQYIQFAPGGGINVQDKFGNKVVMGPLGVAITDKNGNALNLTAAGINGTDVSGNGLLMVAAGNALSDHFGNLISTNAFGFNVSDFTGSFVSSTASFVNIGYAGGAAAKIVLSASGIAFTGTANFGGVINANAGVQATGVTATGAIIAGLGGADQVGLQTHSHPANGSPPTPGT